MKDRGLGEFAASVNGTRHLRAAVSPDKPIAYCYNLLQC